MNWSLITQVLLLDGKWHVVKPGTFRVIWAADAAMEKFIFAETVNGSDTTVWGWMQQLGAVRA